MKIKLILVAILFFLISCNSSTKTSHKDLSLKIENTETRESGFIEVPENRTLKNNKTIKLAYVVIKSRNSNSKKHPILYLQGGPGAPTLFMERFWENNNLRNDRDIVLMDQRGTGLSNSICSDFGSKMFAVLAKNLSPEGEYHEMRKLLKKCKSIAIDKEIDLSAYNSKENAADFEDLRKHLGYEKWNVYGGSYGSRLALTIMRDFPEAVRTGTIFGVFSPEVSLYDDLINNFEQSLFGVFQECNNDLDCSKRYPALKKELFKALDILDKTPYEFDLNGNSFILNSQDMLLAVHQMLYSRATIAQIPLFIKAVNNKNVDIIKRGLQPTINVSNLINFAMNMSMNANDELPFTSERTKAFFANANSNSKKALIPAYFASDIKLLEEWHPYRSLPIENEPVVSDIPTLIANGKFDPVTPPRNAILASKNLSNSYYAEFKSDGHSFFNSCFFNISREFLDAPYKEPDFSCLNQNTNIRWN
ncbi:alpha/beta fold hydrolase [Flavobacteriaceae bacterium AU392]|nr:alpha/beta fold hydrolase [Flavobacteriaceae bacterium]RKM85626.1 alpha/beta fold hydrolase [Flavobacteriaceae bacterium AU392]